jgi:predicted  nucleic acid-binding Zn-ribbon protein
MAITQSDIRELVEKLQADAELQLTFARAFLTERTVRSLMQSDPQLREALRNAVFTEELLQMPATVERIEQRIERVEKDLAEVKQDVAEVKQDVAEVKQDVAEVKTDLASVKSEVAEVKDRVGRLEERVTAVENKLNGLDGRLSGEDFERRTIARAVRILGIGEGGSPREDPAVRQQVLQWLIQGGVLEENGDDESEPLWADLVWWKGDRVVVAEISLKVNGLDVLRAKRRAETLRQAGVNVIPVVIGNEWAHPETPDLANQEGVEWAVGGAYSEGLIAFRRG